MGFDNYKPKIKDVKGHPVFPAMKYPASASLLKITEGIFTDVYEFRWGVRAMSLREISKKAY